MNLVTAFINKVTETGDKAIEILENAFPWFKDEDQNLVGFKDPYLKKFNLTNTERVKRTIKQGTRFYFTILFLTPIIALAFLFELGTYGKISFSLQLLTTMVQALAGLAGLLLFFCIAVTFITAKKELS